MKTKLIGISGPKKSGKTTTIEFLVSKLTDLGFRVGTVKIAYRDVKLDIKKEHYDVERQRNAKPMKTMFKSKSETAVFLNEEHSLRSALLKFSEGLDFILVEGFKENLIGYPQLVLLNEKNQENDYTDEFTSIISSIPEFSIYSNHSKFIPFNKLVDAVFEKSLPIFPELNCGHCGYKTCNELIKEIIQGNKKIQDCYVIENENKDVILEINNEHVACNPFVQTIIKNIMMGFLSSLKIEVESIKEANIKISFNKTEDKDR
ncbi:MAG: hypothetical protein FK731_15205 [Asgard group archaeon]|nr:hypothetical protein [Asgard group archaeon]